uniref:Probable G-protein coupled receptor Mth-like 7 n=1 Tax=Drosophila rhopaloa TaxID=1041015 RepID=A0A6P4E9I0_DRORH
MFSLTAVNIKKVKTELDSFKEQDESTTTCLNFDSQTFLQFMRISVMMGLNWILIIICVIAKYNGFLSPLMDVVGHLHNLYGVIVFVVLVLKRNTLKMLMDSELSVSVSICTGFVLSTICIPLTIAVYLYIPTFQNVTGKCIISNQLCMFILYLEAILNIFYKTPEIFDLFMLADFYAFILWFSVISYHLWKVFKSLSRYENPNEFLIYSVFVWVTSAIMGVVNPMIPIVLNVSEETLDVVLCLPVLVGGIFNVIMFSLTVVNIKKVKTELNSFKEQDESTTTCLNFDTESFLQFTRISVMMGLNWIVIIICKISESNGFLSPLIDVVGHVENLIGVIVFVVLVLKRSTLKMLRDSYHQRQRDRLARALRQLPV